MTDYSKMDHQQLYDYVHSGNPDAMTSTATAWQNHSQALEQATSQLQLNLSAIQSQWKGAAADAYFQQSQDVANKMQTHADNATNTSTAVTNTASALTWARKNMPAPPSWLEQQTANIDSNFVTGAIGFLTTDGAATVASEMAKHDIANKHQQAISTMTQLAGAYTSAESQLPSTLSAIDDPNNRNRNGNNSGSSSSPMIAPISVYPIGGTGGGGGDSAGYHGGRSSGYPGSTSVGAPGSGFRSGPGSDSGGSGAGAKVSSFTNPGGDTFTQGAGAAGGTTAGGVAGAPSSYAVPAESAGSFGAGTGQYGGGIGTGGASGLGAMGAGAGALGAGESASNSAGGYGSVGRYGARNPGAGKGGTDLGGGEGSGIWGGEGSGGTSGPYGSATAAAGEGEGAVGGAESAGQGQPGMMGGMGGRGGAGGSSGEERGNRARFLRQDPDYWYGDRQAAPPGGVIE